MIDGSDLTPEQLQQIALKTKAIVAARQFINSHRRDFPPHCNADGWYPWQHEGFSSFEPQVMTMAGNRTGKTMSAGFHTACDLTGRYPEWWTGFRYEHGINCLAMGVDNQQLKDVVQKELFGDVVEDNNGRKMFSGNWVHQDEIGRVEWSPQLPGLARRVEVKSRYGSANCTLRSYSQSKTGVGSLSFAGTTIDLIWVDECPPDELVGQLVIRTMTGNLGKGGRIRYTMTPELGSTQLVVSFMNEESDTRRLIGPVTWADCPHLTEEIQRQMLENVPEHEKEMRSLGTPFFGAGLIYGIPEKRIIVEPFEVPSHYRVIRAMDLGTRHPTGIVWLAHDSEADVVYLVKDYAVKGEPAAVHAAAANALWSHAPLVFPPDVDTTEKGSGKTVRRFYQDAGLSNTLDFRNPDGTRYVEPGIIELLERMKTGRFKVFNTCQHFLREFRLYHRDEKGRIVKENDDVLDAVRYGVQMLSYATNTQPRVNKPKVKRAMAGKDRRR